MFFASLFSLYHKILSLIFILVNYLTKTKNTHVINLLDLKRVLSYNFCMELILASNSPRRKDLLKKAGFSFKIISSEFSEKNENGGINTAIGNALGKALSVYEKNTDDVVIGADTIVVFKNEMLGKPKDAFDAILTLKKLSGKTHSVITGYAVISKDNVIKGYEETKVTFNDLSDELIEKYVATGLPLDKAGSYGIQDGFNLVKSYTGSFDNIVGLPVEKIVPLILKAGINKVN